MKTLSDTRTFVEQAKYPQGWQPVEGNEEIPVHVITDRGELAR
jgi:hypothetical protein